MIVSFGFGGLYRMSIQRTLVKGRESLVRDESLPQGSGPPFPPPYTELIAPVEIVKNFLNPVIDLRVTG